MNIVTLGWIEIFLNEKVGNLLINKREIIIVIYGTKILWLKIFSKSDEENYYVEDGIVEFKNNNLSILTSSIFNIKDMNKGQIEEIIKQAENDLNNSKINDQQRYLVDQKIDVLKSIN